MNSKNIILNRHKLATFLLIIGCVLMILPIISMKLRLFLLKKISPNSFKYYNFYKMKSDKQDIYLLGTLHKEHLINQDFSLIHIGAVIESLKPDLLLVQSRPEELKKGNVGDGSLEMPFANLTAHYLGIDVNGIDWIDYLPSINESLRNEKISQNIIKNSKGYKKVLVLCEYKKTRNILKKLNRKGYCISGFNNRNKERLFSSNNRKFSFPFGMKYYIQKKIDFNKQNIKSEKDSRKKNLFKEEINFNRELIDIIELVGERTK
ncbi:hypothetical protein [Clostridium rectalis]|uniref:hypothetical protein n=1 Tax=Clostridium rectalis TaxID=2040295 RepID=UPI000F632B1F|nr:hypothetical protein [Clostridium rectalis]